MPYANSKTYTESLEENITSGEYIKPKDIKDISFFTKGSKMQKVVVVPIRQNGMTSSGNKLDCHSNVSKLVSTYGGSEIRGYYVDYLRKLDIFSFTPHSVWKTPEGKLVCVTPDEKGSTEISFLPFAENNPTKNYYSTALIFLVSKNGDFLIDDVNVGVHKITISKSEIKRGVLDIKKMFWGLIDKPFLVSHKSKVAKDYVSFTKPSTATGKYFKLRTLPNDTESRFL